MTDQKKTRAPRQMTVDAIMKQIEAQPLQEKLDIQKFVTNLIVVEKQRLTKDLELINGR